MRAGRQNRRLPTVRIRPPALSTNPRAPNPRHDAPRGAICPPARKQAGRLRRKSTGSNSRIETASNGGRIGRAAPSHNPPSLPRPAGRPSIVSGFPGAGSADERHQELVELRDDRRQVRRVRRAHLAEEGCPLRLLHRIGPEGRRDPGRGAVGQESGGRPSRAREGARLPSNPHSGHRPVASGSALRSYPHRSQPPRIRRSRRAPNA